MRTDLLERKSVVSDRRNEERKKRRKKKTPSKSNILYLYNIVFDAILYYYVIQSSTNLRRTKDFILVGGGEGVLSVVTKAGHGHTPLTSSFRWLTFQDIMRN